ncbi:YbhB/YbcL family Raf kinase inhibitor-like protein [Streptomyces sp. NBC_01351]|uniref:YbhB/YbcL family Raf kinase inhibitor-like protein n=1 Tax=Streptomyces sp. NBC_01351 TaxID=2903833 RepID=UPI002E330C19|nr:YbhB/YbcL family Raf kinase inhibitor-like protein [Streptomyces sp. NBC_01351]
MTGIEISSAAFDDHTAIPRRYSGEGENISPPLTWSAAPEGTAELVLLCEDPDAPGGTFLHWLVTAIDPGATGAEEGQKPRGGLPWPNDFGRVGWSGPMPPPGHGPHRYFFRLHALSEPLTLHGRPTADTVHREVKRMELAVGTLVGTYQR